MPDKLNRGGGQLLKHEVVGLNQKDARIERARGLKELFLRVKYKLRGSLATVQSNCQYITEFRKRLKIMGEVKNYG